MSAQQLIDSRDFCKSDNDPFGYGAAQRHENTSALAQVWYRLSVGDLVLDAIVHRLPWSNGNALAHVGRHDGRACAAVDCDLNINAFVGRGDVADVVPLLLRQLADVAVRPVASKQWKCRGFRFVWVPRRVLSYQSSRGPAILSTQLCGPVAAPIGLIDTSQN